MMKLLVLSKEIVGDCAPRDTLIYSTLLKKQKKKINFFLCISATSLYYAQGKNSAPKSN